MNAALRYLGLALVTLALVACGEQEHRLKFGAKNFGESRILAHMVATLAAEQGLPVQGVVDYPDTRAILEALKRGDIDAYPDYNGTGLVMLGQNPMSDGDAAMARVKELYEPLGLSWRARFGFSNNYGLAMTAERASELGISSISELASRAPGLSIAIEDDFQQRPLDGFDAMNRRYGMTFGGVTVLPLDERPTLYDLLLDGSVDVVEVYTTDGQLADYGLVVLEDDVQFFPVYQAAILARAASLSEHPTLAAVIDSLGGRIDADTMQELNRRVEVEGRSPAAVARDALARMEMISGGAVITDEPVLIAASPLISTGAAATAALRSVRNAYPGREVQIAPSHTPLQDVLAGDARLALVSADAFFDVSGPVATRDERVEAVAAIGQNMVHVVTRIDGPNRLQEASTIAVGPAGSSSYRIGEILADGLRLSAELSPLDADSTADLLAKVADGAADAAIVFAPEGDKAMADALQGAAGLRLLDVTGWNERANLVRFPFLREARIRDDSYRGQFGSVETLGAQLVLAGPAPRVGDVVGDQGPSSVAVGVQPISATAVKAINQAAGTSVFIDPALKQAAALAPELPEPPAPINPDPDVSIFSLLFVVFLVWLCWLYARPEYR